MESKGQELLGTTLGTCLLERLLGAGGMGVVYLARQTRPAREVAVKVLRPGVFVSREEHRAFLLRFRREADVIARLDHVNIMPIYEYGEQNGIAYLVMPYLTGGNLRELLKRQSALPLEQTLAYIEQIAAALDYAHAHKVVHRDIKPANLLFHADGRLVLADFGIARMLTNDDFATEATLTSPGQLIGSIEYMAPEMVHGQYIDHRTDIYELGIVLFQMLSGRVPFQGTSPLMVAAKHMQESPPPLYAVNPAIPPQMDEVVRKALAKHREDRYSSAGALAQALCGAITARPHPVSSAFDASTVVLQPAPVLEPPPIVAPPPVHVYPVNNATADPYASNTLYRSARGQSKGLPLWLGFAGVFLVLLLASGGILLGQQVIKWASAQSNVTSFPKSIATSHPVVAASPSAVLPNATSTPTPTPTPTTTTTPAQQAQAIVRQYYDDINQSNYQGAYQLWGTNYQQAHPYDQFAAGFQNTKHDDIVLGNITPQADGTVAVDFTLYATEGSSSGTIVKTFHGTYTVGQENGRWKLLDANVQQVGMTSPPTPSQQNQQQD